MNPYTLAAGVGTGLLGTALQGAGEMKGLRASGRVVGQSVDEQGRLRDQATQTQTGLYQPYTQVGAQGLQDYQNFRMQPAQSYQQGQFGGVDVTQDPGYAFRMQQGVRALDSSAANRGNLFSGAQQKALAQYGQDLGSQEFQNAYGRQYGAFQDAEQARQAQFNAEQDRNMQLDQFRMGQLQDLAGMGMSATGQLAGQVGSIDQNYGQNMYNLRGAQADTAGARAATPWMTLGKGLSGVGNAVASFFGNKG